MYNLSERSVGGVGTHLSHASLSAPRTTPVTIDTFLADLSAAARRLGYPLDDEAARLLEAALECTPDQWTDRDKRAGAMMRVRKTLLRAVMLSINSGSAYVDARTMAVAIIDAETDAVQARPSGLLA